MSTLRVLIAGGGVVALEAALALRSLAGERVRAELLAPTTTFAFRPASVRTPFGGADAVEIGFGRIAIEHHRGALAAVDPQRHVVRTTDGGELPYDRLIVATGARPVADVDGATLFRGPISTGAVQRAVAAATQRVIFAAPRAPTWLLPPYELALLAAHARADGPVLTIVTTERRPLAVMGADGSDAVARLLDRAGIEFLGSTTADCVVGDALATRQGRLLAADAVIALPRLHGRRIGGLPADADGFLEIDEHARVRGVEDVFAAGDVTAGEVKHGGLGARQADAACEWIAAEAGAAIEPRPYRPVLQALLLTGEAPLYLCAEGGVTHVSRQPLWQPASKLTGRHLADYVADAD